MSDDTRVVPVAATIVDPASYDLEVTMLNAIAASYPTERDGLLAQFRPACVTKRHKSGVGFFTDFEVDQRHSPSVTVPGGLGPV